MEHESNDFRHVLEFMEVNPRELIKVMAPTNHICCRKSKTDKLKAGQSLTVSGSLIKARDKKKNSPLEAFKASTAELLNDTVLSRIITISDDQVQQNPKVGSLKETILVNRVNKQSKMLTSVTLKRIIILSEQFVASKRPMKSIKLPFNFSFT